MIDAISKHQFVLDGRERIVLDTSYPHVFTRHHIQRKYVMCEKERFYVVRRELSIFKVWRKKRPRFLLSTMFMFYYFVVNFNWILSLKLATGVSGNI